ncbi:MAG: hypothetical protein RLZZ76_277 [Candidatus Parcubacteria bacterium]|jgi:hypothetical protein
MEEKVVRKTTVRRTTRKRVTPEGATPTPRVRAVRKTAEVSPVRKAPTRTLDTAVSPVSRRRDSRKLKVIILGTFLFSVLLGVSALIGMSDKGELDVASAITERKQSATSEEEKQALESVPTEQIQPSAPNGGLVGMGAPEPVVQLPEVTASSTEQTASSTEDGAQEAAPTEALEGNGEAPEPSVEEPQATESTNVETVGA